MAGRNLKLKAMAATVRGMIPQFKAAQGAYGQDFDGWKGIQCGGYKLVWKSPCGGFVVKMTRRDMPYKHGAGAEADFYQTVPVQARRFLPVTIKVGEDMCIQPAGVPGPNWGDKEEMPFEEQDRWTNACAQLKYDMGKAGLYNYDTHPKNMARYGKRYKLIDFAGSELTI